MKIISDSNGNKYYEKVYSDEMHDFEPTVEKHIHGIFGDNCIYLSKRKMYTESREHDAIPDGFIIILDKPYTWYVMENELAIHDLRKHISEQVTGFIISLNNRDARDILVNKFYNEIRSNNILFDKVKAAIGEDEVHRFLAELIKTSPTISIVIDERTKALEEVLDSLSSRNPKQVVEFKCYLDKDNNPIYYYDSIDIVSQISSCNKVPVSMPVTGNLLSKVVSKYNDLVIQVSDSDGVVFLPNKLSFVCGQSKRSYGTLIFYLILGAYGHVDNIVKLAPVSCSSDNIVRKKLYNTALANSELFINTKLYYQETWQMLYKKRLINNTEMQGKSEEYIEQLLDRKFNEFYHGDLQKMIEVFSKVRVD